MPVFYAPDLGESNLYRLHPEEATHAIKVLRLKDGDSVNLTDGRGGWHEGVIRPIGRHCDVEITDRGSAPSRPASLTMAVAPTKNNNRFDWFLEKATEIGLEHLIPLTTTHSERQVVKPDRLQRVIRAAVKQSKQAWCPQVEEISTFGSVLERPFEGKRFIAHCYEGDKVDFDTALPPTTNALILIGPEGDFSREEVAMALENGVQPISLGTGRYRTETAALMACHTFHLKNNQS